MVSIAEVSPKHGSARGFCKVPVAWFSAVFPRSLKQRYPWSFHGPRGWVIRSLPVVPETGVSLVFPRPLELGYPQFSHGPRCWVIPSLPTVPEAGLPVVFPWSLKSGYPWFSCGLWLDYPWFPVVSEVGLPVVFPWSPTSGSCGLPVASKVGFLLSSRGLRSRVPAVFPAVSDTGLPAVFPWFRKAGHLQASEVPWSPQPGFFLRSAFPTALVVWT